jgi:Zn-dependent protease
LNLLKENRLRDFNIISIICWAFPIIIAVTLHEAAHGWTAWKLGDDTAYRLGRVNFNPLRHIDPIGTIVIPALLVAFGTGLIFGWAKPVPVNFSRLGRPRRDMILVAAAGPIANIFLAILSILALTIIHESSLNAVIYSLYISININILLAIFNLLPIPPLDGGKVLAGLLPFPLAREFLRLERYGFFIIIALIIILPSVAGVFGLVINPFDWLVAGPKNFITSILFKMVGIL